MTKAKTLWLLGALAVLAAAVGYAVNGPMGAVDGAMFVLIIGWALWRTMRKRSAFVASPDEGERSPSVQRRMRVTGLLFLVYFVTLPAYGLVVAIWHDGDTLAAWINIFQPTADRLSPYIPALERMPRHLIEGGYSEWALPVQHVLLMGWILTAGMVAWIVVMLWLDWRAWSGIRMRKTIKGNAGNFFLASFLFLAVFAELHFGFGTSTGQSFRGVGGLPVLGVLFAGLPFLLAVSTIFAGNMWHARNAPEAQVG